MSEQAGQHPTPKASVIILDDETSVVSMLQQFLSKRGYTVYPSNNRAEFESHFLTTIPDAVIIDLHLKQENGMDILPQLRNKYPDLGIILMTGDDNPELKRIALGQGADVFLQKPISPQELITNIDSFMQPIAMESAHNTTPKQPNSAKTLPSVADRMETLKFPEIITKAKTMEAVLRLIEKVSPRDLSVLLWGESGTGKELFAQAIHNHSTRRDGSFVALNCAALPPNLVESELFGHEKGAFTGAISSHKGKILQASGGTLFLDEIGELPIEIQPKLLRALQERTFVPVGGKAPIESDFRLVCATNRDLVQEVKQGRFREDLFYRIAVFPVKLPPLRDRMEDLELLLGHFLRLEGIENPIITDDAVQRLHAHRWPGNVRELKNFSQAIPLFCDSNMIDRNALGMYFSSRMEGSGFDSDLPSLTETADSQLPLQSGNAQSTTRPVRKIEDIEREEIQYALNYYKGNVAEAARALGMGRATLYKYLKRTSIDFEES